MKDRSRTHEHRRAGTREAMVKLKLQTEDGKVFEVEEAVAWQSQAIKRTCMHARPDARDHDLILLHNVSSTVLLKVLDFCVYHHGHAKPPALISQQEVAQWENEFLQRQPAPTLIDLMRAADSLDIPRLLHLTHHFVAEKIQGMTVDDMRTTFNILSSFTPTEGAAAKEKIQWILRFSRLYSG
ncbi:hypothetical protein L7F22_048936 [Adiantum nelumboides]|nr:hypothetical protein [Adiantum nelumboides]